MADVHDHEDENGKADPLAFQEDFLRECAEAAAAGFPPSKEDPRELPEEEWGSAWQS